MSDSGGHPPRWQILCHVPFLQRLLILTDERRKSKYDTADRTLLCLQNLDFGLLDSLYKMRYHKSGMMRLSLTNLLERLRLRKRPPPFSKEEVLASKPLRNPYLEWERNEEGEIVITIRRRSDWKGKVLGMLFPVPAQRTIVLDEAGTFVWDLCDGETDLQTMIRQLAQRYQLNLKEAELSLTTYLRAMGKRGLVGFAVSAAPKGDGEAAGDDKSQRAKRKHRRRR
ncbi:MAG: PqqD family protein [Abditibacteriales bacterium]|nr:PqqD family protein [Abditibacteriales bacterium]MDW8365224.1 PqqD family protein [Abditibacteriales bacterium]